MIYLINVTQQYRFINVCCACLQAEFAGLYNRDNVVLTATHTHGSAGGFMDYFLYHITSWGWVQQSFEALLQGVLEVRNNLKAWSSCVTVPRKYTVSP